MLVKFKEGTKDVPIMDVTAENYIVPDGEEGTYHCRIEQRQFNPNTGERLSRPFIQKFPSKMWPALLRNLKQQGWTVEILHDPTEFNRKEEEKRRLTAAQRAKAAQEAEARRKKAEREAMKKSIIEELKKEGLIKDKG